MKTSTLLRAFTGLAVGLMVLLPIVGCGQTTAASQPAAQPAAQSSAPPIELTIVNTNDVHGYVEPCG